MALRFRFPMRTVPGGLWPLRLRYPLTPNGLLALFVQESTHESTAQTSPEASAAARGHATRGSSSDGHGGPDFAALDSRPADEPGILEVHRRARLPPQADQLQGK